MKKLKASVLFLIFTGAGYAQEATTSAGGDAGSSTGTVSYSIGQITYETYSGINGSVAQGVQQPYEIMAVVGIEMKEIQLELSAYPNPATHYLTLKVENYTTTNLTFQLIDMEGKLILSDAVTSELTQIPMSQLPIASYFLSVNSGEQLIKNFKIIKH